MTKDNKWYLCGEIINNKVEEIDKRVVVVKREYIAELEKHNIPYYFFSNAVKRCYLIRQGVKKKRFSKEECEEIKKKKINGATYRSLALEYSCSTRTINKILKNKY